MSTEHRATDGEALPGPRSRGLALSFATAGACVLGLSLLLLWSRSWSWSGPASLVLLVAGIGLMAGPFLTPGPGATPTLEARTSGRTAVPTLRQDATGYTASEQVAPRLTEYSEGDELRSPTRVPEHWSTSWMAAAAAPEVADVLWQSWNVTPGELPVGLAPPVPETAYTAPRPDAPLLHAEGEPVALEKLIANEPAYWAARDAASLSASQPSPASTQAPAAGIEAPAAPTLPSPSAPPLSGSSAGSVGASVSTLSEALELAPPHLRAGAPSHPSPEAGVSRPAPASPAARCASCRRWIHDPKFWSRCGDCHSHLCTHCVVESLLAYEWAWCTHCAGLRHMNALVHEIGPERPGKAPRPLHSTRKALRTLTVKNGGINRARWTPTLSVVPGPGTGLPV